MTELSLQTFIDNEIKDYFMWSGGFDYHTTIYVPLQLKDGSILIYTPNYIKILSKNLNQKNLISFNENEEEESIIITSVKEIEKGKIFCCAKDLYVISIKSKDNINKEKIIMPNDESILDVIKLKNGKILGVTKNTILEIKIEENYKIYPLFKIPKNWLIKSYEEKRRFYSGFKQYINLYELPNDRLLIHSHSTELSHNGGCGTHPPYEICINKIYILNWSNFEIVHQFDELKS